MSKEIIMCLSIDELTVISGGLNLLKKEFSTNAGINKIDIQHVIDRVDNAMKKIEYRKKSCKNFKCK